jgi:hypothetical protein
MANCPGTIWTCVSYGGERWYSRLAKVQRWVYLSNAWIRDLFIEAEDVKPFPLVPFLILPQGMELLLEIGQHLRPRLQDPDDLFVGVPQDVR